MDGGIDTSIGIELGIAVLAPYQYHSGIAGMVAKPVSDSERTLKGLIIIIIAS
jgi:hypothetical protein